MWALLKKMLLYFSLFNNAPNNQRITTLTKTMVIHNPQIVVMSNTVKEVV